ncbi:hypothetical protein ANCDUO_05076 [Ancylostoma duodenale]|uniref:Uncharacterized protein n=1 Tax=Ancylostoma duodenale TaxID=51022 RepID=A0A0C2D4X9_9BILA|nr:hypothetical protein ANCDUO_05076 [Ancylostoma duodenale]
MLDANAEDRDACLAAKREAKKSVAIAKSKCYKELYDALNTSEGEKLLSQLAKARPVLPIVPAELSEAIKKLKRNKATGPDDIPADVWKLMGESGAT